MKSIAILVPNISGNCMGRAYILAEVLSRHYEVEIIGPDFGQGIWPPCQSIPLKYVPIPAQNYFQYLLRAIKYLAKSDIIYAIKPLITSYGLALLAHFRYGLPIVLDIDDWELGFAYWRLEQSKKIVLKFFNSHWVGWIFILERFIKHTSHITVSGTFLQQRYGGTLISHGRDTTFLNPTKFDNVALRNKHHLTHQQIILFLGTPKAYKGIEDLIKAVQLIPNPHLKLLLVGAEITDPYVKSLLNLGENRLEIIGMRPLEELPEWLMLADIIVIPQRNSSIVGGQTPAKLFDAMSMAKPIISTEVGDIPDILAGCGFIVPPGDVVALANMINHVLDNPDKANILAQAARKKCIEKYSWEVMEKQLVTVFSAVGEK